MGKIKVTYDLNDIEGLCLLEPSVYEDSRGYFMETFSQKDMYEAGLYYSFVQDNQSMSTKGVLRGLHFQKRFPQAKLVRVIRGAVYDVAVDLRRGSNTYGQYHGEILTAENKKQFLIPRGFAHGFLVISDEAEFCYKCDDFYHPNDEAGIIWNDRDLGIEWPGIITDYRAPSGEAEYCFSDGSLVTLSDKDRKWPDFLTYARGDL